jgi:hypothetical protein
LEEAVRGAPAGGDALSALIEAAAKQAAVAGAAADPDRYWAARRLHSRGQPPPPRALDEIVGLAGLKNVKVEARRCRLNNIQNGYVNYSFTPP